MRQSRREAVKRLAVGVAGFAVSWLALATPTAHVALAQSGSQVGATIDQTGWSNRTNAVPASPVPGVTLPPLTVPAPPSVPAGTIAVGATAGEIDKAAAVGIAPEISSGTVEHAILTIAEAATGEQVNNTGSDAVIVACPITQFWVGEPNGQWSNLPPNSCTTAKVVGERSPDGMWSFDLTPIAGQWLTPGVLAPNGVVLLPEVASPSGATFQVVLEGDPANIGIDFAATPPAPPTTAGPPTTAPATGGGSPPPITSAAPGPTLAPTPTTAVTTTTTAKSVDVSATDKILGNLPGGALLLVPLVLIVAFLLMIALGPLGEPTTGVAREGGVSRALAARERAAADLASSTPALEAP